MSTAPQLFFFLLLGIAASPQLAVGGITIGWQDCGTAGKTHGKVSAVKVSPEQPVPGDNVTITATVDIDKNTTAINGDLIFAKIFHNKFDGCAGATIKAPLNIATVTIPPPGCPVTGTKEFVRYVATSHTMPKGSTTSELTATDQDGESFICVQITLKNDAEEEPAVPVSAGVIPTFTKDSQGTIVI